MGEPEPSQRESYGGGSIVVCDYDPTWPAQFLQEGKRLEEALGPEAVSVEHVGSTAVPGLAAKPIIDLLVGVRSLDRARRLFPEPLSQLGYRYMVEYESWLPGELLFRRVNAEGVWTHHAHVVEPLSARWQELLLVRDYLRAHAEIAAAYGALKKALATVFVDDIAGFRQAKRPFLDEVMARARRDEQSHRGR